MSHKETSADPIDQTIDYFNRCVHYAIWLGRLHRLFETKIPGLTLSESDRDALRTNAPLPMYLEEKLSLESPDFDYDDAIRLISSIVDAACAGESSPNASMFALALRIEEQLNRVMDPVAKAHPIPEPTSAIFQLRIELIDSYPPIWRRIQIQDCSLDELHLHIQTAMGWECCHLHEFQIGKQVYCDLALLDDWFEESTELDTSMVLLSNILPKRATKKPFSFLYRYEFGDDWKHSIVFEGKLTSEDNIKVPICIEGERTCPPEDSGGIYCYMNHVQALADPEDEDHDWAMELLGKRFDPERFDPKATTRRMRKAWKLYHS